MVLTLSVILKIAATESLYNYNASLYFSPLFSLLSKDFHEVELLLYGPVIRR